MMNIGVVCEITAPPASAETRRSPNSATNAPEYLSRGGLLFARAVTVRLKANAVGDFTRTLENVIIPILRKQRGFQDKMILVTPDGTEAVGISLWDNRQSAEAYRATRSPRCRNWCQSRSRGLHR